MCLICEYKNKINEIKYIKTLYCLECKNITKLPKELINLEILFCNNTNISEIPDTYIKLKKLNISKCKNIKELSKNFKELEILYCIETNITNIPYEYENLIELCIENTPIQILNLTNSKKLKSIIALHCNNLKKININNTKIYI